MHESKMGFMISFLKKNIPLLETCVYVVGRYAVVLNLYHLLTFEHIFSTKLQTPRSEEICKAIGTELAKVKNITVVTSGFYGAGDIVAKSFHQCRQDSCPLSQNPSAQCKMSENNPNSFESSVVHIVPLKDSEVCSHFVKNSF